MLNDNLLKMSVILLLVGPRGTEAERQTATFHGFLAYTLPYVLLSLPAGRIADAWSKQRVLVVLKAAEVGAMLLAGLALADGRPAFLLGTLALVGTLGALASPTKYGLLPELLPDDQLARGNGFFLLGSWLALILGTGSAGALLDAIPEGARIGLGALLALIAWIGLEAARRIPARPAAGRDQGVWATARAGWQQIRTTRALRMAVLASTFFWTLGALLQQDVVVYAKSSLELSDTATSLMQAALALGVGLGSVAVGQLAAGRLGVRWVHRGAAAMGLLLFALGLVSVSAPVAGLLLLLVGAASGLILVPLNSLAQSRSTPALRGAVIAVLNVCVFSGVLLGSLAGALLGQGGHDARQIFLVAGFAALAGAIWARTTRGVLLRTGALPPPAPRAAPPG
jgi:acyl-[acyl-carrier-protein]-phospholipid O-acyltransferase/long-chain-fatty-acid--[acyl-carrier-protein] ligase